MSILQAIIAEIDVFDQACAEAEYTDSEQAWDLLHWIKAQVKILLVRKGLDNPLAEANAGEEYFDAYCRSEEATIR